MVERETFIAALAQNPADDATRKVFADWLEDQGDVKLAFAYRWCGHWSKWPHFRDRHPTTAYQRRHAMQGRKVNKESAWAWFRQVRLTSSPSQIRPATACIPAFIFACIGGHDHKFYPSYDAAMLSLANGLHQMTEALRIQ